jgi:hypothetical protein
MGLTPGTAYSYRVRATDSAGNISGYSAVASATTSLCGNGATEPGEQCDTGAANGTATSCCTSSCTFQPTTYACNQWNGVYCTGSGSACPTTTKPPYADVTQCNSPCGNGTCDSALYAETCANCPIDCGCCSPLTMCSGQCMNLQSDAHNCGTCGHNCQDPNCGQGSLCSAGYCWYGTCTYHPM